MILKERSLEVTKIKETEQNWWLYIKGSDKPLALSKDRVYGKLPPVRKFPWQNHTLNIKFVADYIAYAEMDGLILFDTPEEQYPENIKEEVARIRKNEEEYALMQKEYRDSLQIQLSKYLPSVPFVAQLEDSFAGLPVCWRMYLKMHLPMLYQNDDSRQRLTLMYWLITIANRLYHRHTDTQSEFSIIRARSEFTTSNFAVAQLSETLINEIEHNPEQCWQKGYAFYFEVRNELRRVLPPMPQRLEHYLIQTICNLLEAYAQDIANFIRHRPQAMGTPMTTDNRAYRKLLPKMRLPCFKALIIENMPDKAQIEQFNHIY